VLCGTAGGRRKEGTWPNTWMGELVPLALGAVDTDAAVADSADANLDLVVVGAGDRGEVAITDRAIDPAAATSPRSPGREVITDPVAFAP